MENNFAENFITKLDGKLSTEQMKLVLTELQIFSSDYDIERKCTDIMVNGDVFPYFYKIFIVAKKIEGMSMKSIITYQSNLKDFFYNIHKPIEDLTTNDIRIYLYDVQKRRGICNRTLDGKRLILNSFFDWAFKEEYLKSNPVARISPIKFTEKPREPLTDIEFEMVRDACDTTRERAIVEFFYSTGCRVSEMEILKREDVNFQTKEVHLFGKGSKHRTSYINAKAEYWLKKYWAELKELGIDDEGYCFYTCRKPYSNMKKQGIESMIHKIGVRANLSSSLFPHRIRHTTATNLLNHGMPLPEIQNLLGHEKADTTLIYAKISQGSIEYNHKKCLY